MSIQDRNLRPGGDFKFDADMNELRVETPGSGGKKTLLTSAAVSALGSASPTTAQKAALNTQLGLGTGDSPTFTAVSTDTVSEATAAAGVTVDGVLCKDGEIVLDSGDSSGAGVVRLKDDGNGVLSVRDGDDSAQAGALALTLGLVETTEPADPVDGQCVIWFSQEESTGTTLGDLMVKLTVGGTTVTKTLASFGA